MAYTVTIVYTGPKAADAVDLTLPICPIYTTTNSYVDSTAYAGTVYDTNVQGFGSIEAVEPYASTGFPFPVPLAQFKMAVIGTAQSDGSKKYEFEVDDYKEAIYYTEVGAQLADQGFTVTVTEKTEG